MNSKAQAQRIYEFCVPADTPVTYRDVLEHLGYKAQVTGQAIRFGLELVRIACAQRELPVLTAIFVNKSTGKLSDGALPSNASAWEVQRNEVFACHD